MGRAPTVYGRQAREWLHSAAKIRGPPLDPQQKSFGKFYITLLLRQGLALDQDLIKSAPLLAEPFDPILTARHQRLSG